MRTKAILLAPFFHWASAARDRLTHTSPRGSLIRLHSGTSSTLLADYVTALDRADHGQVMTIINTLGFRVNRTWNEKARNKLTKPDSLSISPVYGDSPLMILALAVNKTLDLVQAKEIANKLLIKGANIFAENPVDNVRYGKQRFSVFSVLDDGDIDFAKFLCQKAWENNENNLIFCNEFAAALKTASNLALRYSNNKLHEFYNDELAKLEENISRLRFTLEAA